VQKGAPVSRLLRAVRNALTAYHHQQEGALPASDSERDLGMIGDSRPMRERYRIIRKLAPTDTKAMILGETGTGKELVATALHRLSSRSQNRYGVFNCNHKSPDLVESELFGHCKGAFTGAICDNVGLFDYADGGTIFLDEIGDLDITTQAKILRVLETGEFQAVGKAVEMIKTDVRVLCATNRDLPDMVKRQEFREDLFYRLKGIVITMPPLRVRKEDIPLLVSRFVDRFTVEQGQLPKVFDSSAIEVMLDYDWPGNVRELLDVVESLIVLSDSHLVTADDVTRYLQMESRPFPAGGVSLSERVQEFRRNCIIEALNQTNGNASAAARQLGIDAANLRKQIRASDLNPDSFKTSQS
jgi:Nif-specific regulatory protein